MGTYCGHNAAFICWSLLTRTGGSVLNPDISVTCHENILALRPNTVASILLGPFTSPEQREESSSYMEAFEKNVPISFVTSGDVDGNYKVNAKDALAILKHGVGKQLLEDELALLLADCDKNDIIDATDALFTLRKAVFK